MWRRRPWPCCGVALRPVRGAGRGALPEGFRCGVRGVWGPPRAEGGGQCEANVLTALEIIAVPAPYTPCLGGPGGAPRRHAAPHGTPFPFIVPISPQDAAVIRFDDRQRLVRDCGPWQ